MMASKAHAMKKVAVFSLIFFHMHVAAYAQPQPTGGMPKTNVEQENRFIPLEVPPPYSYQDGSLNRLTVENRRFISFVGTTAMPPYFSYIKNSPTYERAFWQKQLLLSKGRWAFKYQVDCESTTFDRDGDQVGWRDIYLDGTAYAMHTLFCPESTWARLPWAQ